MNANRRLSEQTLVAPLAEPILIAFSTGTSQIELTEAMNC